MRRARYPSTVSKSTGGAGPFSSRRTGEGLHELIEHRSDLAVDEVLNSHHEDREDDGGGHHDDGDRPHGLTVIGIHAGDLAGGELLDEEFVQRDGRGASTGDQTQQDGVGGDRVGVTSSAQQNFS
jgi:hypothetical protein